MTAIVTAGRSPEKVRIVGKSIRTKSLDLTDGSGQLSKLAPFKVLSVMCYPEDGMARQRMLNLLKAETGDGRVRGTRITNDEFWVEVRGTNGPLAGALLLNLLQLDGNRRRSSLNDAIRMAQGLLGTWSAPTGAEWHEFDWTEHLPRRRDTLLRIFKEYISAAHLWAAFLHAEEHQRQDIWLGHRSTLPRFIAHAEAFAVMASRVRWSGADRRYLLPSRIPWRFVLPERLSEHVELVALSLDPEQIAAINTPSA